MKIIMIPSNSERYKTWRLPVNLKCVPPIAGSMAPTAMSTLEITRYRMILRRQKTQALYMAPPTRATVPKVLNSGVIILMCWGIAAPERTSVLAAAQFMDRYDGGMLQLSGNPGLSDEAGDGR